VTQAGFLGAGRQADATKPVAEREGEFLSSLPVLSSITSHSNIADNQEGSIGRSCTRLRIGVGQCINQIHQVGEQSRCGHRWVQVGFG
jgi:hypothetical protein